MVPSFRISILLGSVASQPPLTNHEVLKHQVAVRTLFTPIFAEIGNLRVAVAAIAAEWRIERAVGCAGPAFDGRGREGTSWERAGSRKRSQKGARGGGERSHLDCVVLQSIDDHERI